MQSTSRDVRVASIVLCPTRLALCVYGIPQRVVALARLVLYACVIAPMRTWRRNFRVRSGTPRA
jgi:hypothetical protein